MSSLLGERFVESVCWLPFIQAPANDNNNSITSGCIHFFDILINSNDNRIIVIIVINRRLHDGLPLPG